MLKYLNLLIFMYMMVWQGSSRSSSSSATGTGTASHSHYSHHMTLEELRAVNRYAESTKSLSYLPQVSSFRANTSWLLSFAMWKFILHFIEFFNTYSAYPLPYICWFSYLHFRKINELHVQCIIKEEYCSINFGNLCYTFIID